MATVYVSPNGDDSRTYTAAQSRGTPWASPAKAIASATAGDTVRYFDGAYRAPVSPGYHNFTKRLLNDAESDLAVTWQAAEGHTLYVARAAAALDAGAISFDGIVADGESRVAAGFEIGANDSAAWTVGITNCLALNCTARPVSIFARRGTINISNFQSTGPLSAAAITTASNDAGAVSTAPMSISISDVLLTHSASAPNQITGINIASATTRLSAVTVNISGVGGAIASHSGSFAVGISVLGVDDAVIDGGGKTLTIQSSNAAAECYGVRVFGRGASSTADDAVISGMDVRFLAPAGHAILLGVSTSDNFMSGGLLSGNVVSGDYYATSTPHGITQGQGTTSSAFGDLVELIYAGYLASKTTSGSRRGSTAIDCYGPSYYAKGTTAFTFSGNTATLTGRFTQRDVGVLAVAYQGATDCTAVTFSNNLVVVADASKIHSLASISGLAAAPSTAQPATFENNVYIIPDTVDLGTAVLFTYGGVIGAAANQTYAQWLANAEVTGDTIVQMPVEHIKRFWLPGGGSAGNRSVLTAEGWLVQEIQ